MRLRRRHVAGPAIALAVVTTVAGCTGAGGAGAAGNDETLDIATLSVPQSMDPATAVGSTLPFFQAVYDTLIKREPDGSYSPMLATEWSWNESRTSLSLTLREGVTFDDGSPFDAAAVRANLEHFKNSGGANAKWLSGLREVEVLDPRHVVLHLDESDPALVHHLSDAAGLMANPATLRKDSALETTPAGTGPYELDEDKSIVGSKWVYVANAGYWGEPLPYDEVTMSVFDDETAVVNGLKTGQIDTAVLQDANQQKRVTQAANLRTTTFEFDFKGILLFDRGGVVTPALADPRVRRALNHAVDRQTMLDKIRLGQGTLTSQIFGPDNIAYKKSLDGYYEHDPAKARDLLADAGYADGFELRMPRMTTLVSEALASSLRSDLAEVGVTLTWVDVTRANALRRVFQDREFSALVMNLGQPSNDWATIADYVLPGTFNAFGYSDDTSAELVSEIRNKRLDAAKAELESLNQHLVNQGWFVPFYRMEYMLVSDSGVDVRNQAGMAVPSIYNYERAS